MKKTLHIEQPCSMRWDAMSGGESERHCESCRKPVHDLASLTAREASELLHAAEGSSLCVRVEHDRRGAIRYKSGPAGPRAVLTIALGASLLATDCTPATHPTQPPAAETTPAATVEMVAPMPTSPSDALALEDATEPSTLADPSPRDPLGLEPLPVPSVSPTTERAKGSELRQRGMVGETPTLKPPPEPRTSHTIGCVCMPNDSLCPCM